MGIQMHFCEWLKMKNQVIISSLSAILLIIHVSREHRCTLCFRLVLIPQDGNTNALLRMAQDEKSGNHFQLVRDLADYSCMSRYFFPMQKQYRYCEVKNKWCKYEPTNSENLHSVNFHKRQQNQI